VFADQAAVAIQIGARALDAQELLRLMLDGDVPEDEEALQSMIAAATRSQSGDDSFWSFVDAIVGLRLVAPHDRTLAIDVLDAVGRHARERREHSAPRRFRR
jgi:hypothetical protein